MSFMPWLLALFVLVGGAQPAENPTAIVSARWTQYTDGTARHDVDAIANLFAADARLMGPGADDVIGRLAIRSLMTYAFSLRVRPVDVHMMPREVVAYDGVIYDLGNYIETVAPQGDPKGAFDVYGRYFAVWDQQPDGTWKIARLMVSTKKQPAR